MRKIGFIFIITISAAITSCTTTYNSTEAKYADIKSPGVFHMPLVADLEVQNEQISGENNSITSGTTSENRLREGAIANALERSKADVLIEPVFTKKTENNKITVTVRGWPASYKNFRNMTENDIDLVKMGQVKEVTSKIKKTTATRTNTKKSSKPLAIAAVLGGGLAIILAISALFN